MNKKKIVVGVIFMALGVIWLLNNIGLIFIPHVYHFIISWQAILIAIGIVLLFDKRSDNRNGGIILIFIGSLFLFPKIFPISVKELIIPLVAIAVGIGLIIKAVTRKKEIKDYDSWCNGNSNWKIHFGSFEEISTKEKGGVIHKEYVFSGSKEKWTQGKLRNVSIEAVFSGVELDFSQAELADDIKVAAHIKVQSVFSGITLYVPDDWNIMIQKTGAFGGFTDNRPNRVLQASSDKLVVLELEAVFGGGEIRCYE
jgi:predicted membrane protein